VTKKTFKGHRLDHPVVIELESPDGERTLTVNCVPSLPGSVFLELASVIQFEPSEEGTSISTKDVAQVADAAAVLLKVLKMAIKKDEWDGFKAFIDEPDNGVDAEMLAEIAGFIAEEYTGGNPPTPPSS
jgi:hypothetical protein